jgi:hypothetical protein
MEEIPERGVGLIYILPFWLWKYITALRQKDCSASDLKSDSDSDSDSHYSVPGRGFDREADSFVRVLDSVDLRERIDSPLSEASSSVKFRI